MISNKAMSAIVTAIHEDAGSTPGWEPLVVVLTRNCPGSVVHYLDEE